ncbi:hypothetical protein B0H67DRAFT_117461 [Lasiosphaeris hirsuta]|uniref:T6SS Phospholipase effector Tle1-like catalytic domain-containing protein n=1 Tax=Lasiosphaeris hirsuta TaxID=260670 RepID=A0AA40AZG8_9PEZI|nr:hypothetical protein B0H67DRAFT_117461 [Lasiosphaeris hirsuta]
MLTGADPALGALFLDVACANCYCPLSQYIQRSCHVCERSRSWEGAGIWTFTRSGTMAGSVVASRGTVVPHLAHAISNSENKISSKYEGVGNTGRVLRWVWEGVTGSGAKKIVFKALDWLAENYRPGDRIIMIGYSRGGWKACYLAKVIQALGGLPKNGDQELYHNLYKRSSKSKVIRQHDVADVMHGYQVHKDVDIEALCLFDAVSSMGLPTTGIATPIALIKGGWTRKDEVIMELPSNVQNAFSAVSLYETRAPYASTLLRGRAASNGRLKQVAFAGNHGNLGWINKGNQNSLILAPLAWMIQQLHGLGIQFDTTVLDEYFSLAQSQPGTHSWMKGSVFRAHGYEHLIGTAAPNPGRIVDSDGDAPAVEIHSTVRLRGYGRTPSDSAVPGYKLATEAGSHRWVRANESSSRRGTLLARTWLIKSQRAEMQNSGRQAPVLEEALVGDLETRLLGLAP